MRKAGDFDNEAHARRFADFLLTERIETKVEQDQDQWQVWVILEQDLDNARFEYEEFIESPDNPLYRSAGREAEVIRRRKKQKERDQTKNQVNLGRQWHGRSSGLYPLTLTLIGLSVIATFYSGKLFPSKEPAAEARSARVLNLMALPPDKGPYYLPQQVTGQFQVWRLITPIFPHLSPMHLLFNMWFLLMIGQMIEIRRGLWIFLGLIISLAIVTNLCTYWWYLMTTPGFGFGMSGVLYGLFGYALIKTQFDRSKGIFVSQSTIFILIAWLFICMTGLVGPIANAAHVSGLIAGAAISYAPIAWNKLQRWRKAS